MTSPLQTRAPLVERAALPDPQRFWRYVQKTPHGCWSWTGTDHNGGRPQYGGQVAHRIAYLLSGYDIPAGHHLHHDCERPECVRPDHMRPLAPDDHATYHQLPVSYRLMLYRHPEVPGTANRFGVLGYRSRSVAERAAAEWQAIYPAFAEAVIMPYRHQNVEAMT